MEFTLKKIEKLCIKGFLELKQKKDASKDLTDLDILMEYTCLLYTSDAADE